MQDKIVYEYKDNYRAIHVEECQLDNNRKHWDKLEGLSEAFYELAKDLM